MSADADDPTRSAVPPHPTHSAPPAGDYATHSIPRTAEMTVAPHAPAAPPRPAVPGYDVIDLLGEGGMGVVWKARQLGLNRLVALKMVPGAGPIGRRDLIRFLAEAEAVAAVRHPNVVQVFEFGDVGGRPFLAMEYLPGGSLADRLKSGGRLAPGEAAGLVATLARAVQAAHDLQIIHRDLKPGNVLFDEVGVPKVGDFGLAKRGAGGDLTATGAFLGTPAYMAPEQAGGEAKFAGPAADVWALGVILYEAATGVRPFRGDTTWAILNAVRETDPAPPRRFAPAVPRDLELVILKCLAKDPADRYTTAAALADDLHRFAAGEPVSVRAAGVVERAAKWARRKPTLAAAYALTLLAVLLGGLGGVAAWQWIEAATALDRVGTEKRAADDARADAETAHGDAERARADLARLVDQVLQLRYVNDSVARQFAQLTEGTSPGGELTADQVRTLAPRLEELFRRLRYYESVRRADTAAANSPADARAILAGCPADCRGWEWDHVSARCGRPGAELSFRTSARPVRRIAFRPDGSAAAVGGGVWDLVTGGGIEPPGPTPRGSVLGWSPDGRRVELFEPGGYYGIGHRLRLVRDGEPGAVPDKQGDQFFPQAVWAAGERVKLATRDGFLLDYDFRRPGPLPAVVGTGTRADGAAFDGTGRVLATAGPGGVGVWDAATGQRLVAVPTRLSGTRHCALGTDGRLLVVAGAADEVEVWEVGWAWLTRFGSILPGSLPPLSAGPPRLLAGHRGAAVTAVAVHPSSARVATGAADGAVRLWDPATGSETFRWSTDLGEVTTLAFSEDGFRLAAGGAGGLVRVWTARARTAHPTVSGIGSSGEK